MIKYLALKGCQFLSKEIISRDKKLRGGPGITGKIEPAMPTRAIINPNDNRAIDMVNSMAKKNLKLSFK